MARKDSPPPAAPVRKRIRKQTGPAGADPAAKSATGPGNPPEASRFKPGQSGNPKGRPPKERNLLKLVEAELDVEMQLTQNGEHLRLTKRQAFAKRLVHDALNGDARATTNLLKLVATNGSDSEPGPVQFSLEDIIAFLARNGISLEKGH